MRVEHLTSAPDRALRRTGRLAAMGLVLSLGLTIVACGDGDDEPTGAPSAATTDEADATSVAADAVTYVGTIEGTDAYVAVVDHPDGPVAYLCDGARIWADLAGERSGDDLHLADEEGVELVATLADDSITGTVTLADGSTHEFTASPATSGTAGLVQTLDANGSTATSATWIRLDDGSYRGKVVDIEGSAEGGGAVEPEAGDAPPPPPVATGGSNSNVGCAVKGLKLRRVTRLYNAGRATFDEWDAARAEAFAACS